ncbi:ComEC/Rec2 family competence protein [Salegentibacter sp. F188]|uniref:ComEC/Rec2 family competence protein n=1 Tax=Autumnicola patrickiae TaxID=3075591 RepID=A0ABU3E297_9FLAO|nr:ComEC/Rec2 family competence protein [Salegentibacter sp. F188]MDT0689397.1 ComEC/Rec2 family competence protein [Salegentibacter sp. F188]
MRFLNVALIKLCLVFLLGVLIGFYAEFSSGSIIAIFGTALFLFIFAFIRATKNIFQDVFFEITAYLVFFCIGLVTVYLHKPENQPNHYIHYAKNANSEDIIKVTITERLKDGFYAEKYIAEASEAHKNLSEEEKFSRKKLTGKILINISKDSADLNLKVGDELLIPADLEEINQPLNPYQFNYRKYMENLGVLRQIDLSKSQIEILKDENWQFKALAEKWRNKSISSLSMYSFQPEEMAIIQALILGNRREISTETYENYAAAGAVHILAVSGLHVGIILLILNWLLRPVEFLPKGRYLKMAIIVLLLWGFAFIAGLSPSVIRAVTMFSFLAIGMQLKRKTSALNTLFMSLLVLLLINPYYIFQVGFQLSYLAVFAIVTIQPKLYNLYVPKNKIPDYFWKILSVSIAAQIGVLPLSLYYFHQFPGLFFVTNLVLLPFIGLILGLGILVIFLALINALPHFLAQFYGSCIAAMNRFVDVVAAQEVFVLDDIPFSALITVLAYLLIIFGIILIYKLNFRNLSLFLIAIIFLQLGLIFEKFHFRQSEALVFHKSRGTVLGFRNNDTLTLFTSENIQSNEELFLKNYKVATKADTVISKKMHNIYNFTGEKLLVVDSAAVYNFSGFKPDILLLTNSPKINLARLASETDLKQIIADGSNYRSYVEQWKQTAENKKIPFHYTGEKGAFVSSAKSD